MSYADTLLFLVMLWGALLVMYGAGRLAARLRRQAPIIPKRRYLTQVAYNYARTKRPRQPK